MDRHRASARFGCLAKDLLCGPERRRRNAIDITAYDCAGRHIETGQVDRPGTYLLHNNATGAVQKVFVIQ
jgi:hypothetical protein